VRTGAAQVGKLERRGIVEKRRNQADGRSNVIALTDLGRRLIEDLGPLRREVNDMMYGSLDGAQVEQLVEIVSVLHRDATRALHMLDSPEHRGRVAPSATGGGPARARARRLQPHTPVPEA
jgi:DNA-binding PadR family transcriptional regulator